MLEDFHFFSLDLFSGIAMQRKDIEQLQFLSCFDSSIQVLSAIVLVSDVTLLCSISPTPDLPHYTIVERTCTIS